MGERLLTLMYFWLKNVPFSNIGCSYGEGTSSCEITKRRQNINHRINLYKKPFIFSFSLKWEDDTKQFEIMILSMLIVWTFGLTLVTYEGGYRVANQFDQFGFVFGQCGWQKLPNKMRQMYLTFLWEIQQPKNIKGYGGIMITRETFERVP